MGLVGRLRKAAKQLEKQDGLPRQIDRKARLRAVQRKPIHPIRHVTSRTPAGGSGPSEKALLRAWRAGKLQVEPADPRLVEQFNRALENALPPQPGLDSDQGRLF